jgi:hypothetical protein
MDSGFLPASDEQNALIGEAVMFLGDHYLMSFT